MMRTGKTRHPSMIMLVCLMLEVFLLIMPSSCRGCFKAERAALLDFKAGVVDDPSYRLSSWKADEDCCRWSDVVCDNQTGHVVELNLQNDDDYYSSSAMKVGFLNQSLLSLTHLDRLNLSYIDFGGIQIPEFMGFFPKLRYLDLSSSNFSSKIPSQLGNLSTLLYLDLSIWRTRADRLDWLSGLSSLIYLNMDVVDLSEADHEWLPMVNMLPSLQELHLEGCELKTLHFSLSYENLNLTALTLLDLSHNNFNSTLPTWLWQLGSLSYLDLSFNSFYGVIPSGIGNLTSLTYLDLSWNHYLEIGGIAKSITRLSNLETLVLARTNLKGELPRWLKQLTRLSHLDLNSNLLSGDLAYWLFHMTTNYHNSSSKYSNLNYLDLSYNNLQGNLSELHFSKLTKLKTLVLSYNNLQGNLSELHFSKLTKLKILDLSGNSQLTMNSDNWIPPFQLQYIGLASCALGPKFPRWLRSQKSIQALDLSNSSIDDALPDWIWTIFSSNDTSSIDLSNNRIHGSLPISLTNLTNLYYLNISRNLFNGSIPSLPPNMVVLDFSGNAFWGPLPSTFPSNIWLLTLSSNCINGSMPVELCNLKRLYILNLENNQLSGEIPRCWGEATKDLQYINLGNNNLSGEVPSAMGNLVGLQLLQLNNNSLHGLIPLSMQNCSSLNFLDIGENKLSGNIPSWIGQSFPHLQVLRLSSNMFSGNIPTELGRLSHLQIIDFANNKLSGLIPPSFGNFNAIINTSEAMVSTQFGFSDNDNVSYNFAEFEIISINTKGRTDSYSTNLQYVKSIDLSNNNLFGNVPHEIGALLGLQNLNLSRNNLQGEIPYSVGNMKSLESLDLSFNKLSGAIPQSLSQLNYLEHLNMSYNNFSGRIPLGNQIQTLDDPFNYVGNAYLCGPPLNTSCSIVDNNVVEEATSQKLWHYVSIATGFVVGLWSVFVILLFKKDCRIFYFQLIDKMYDEIYVQIVVTYARFMRKLNGGHNQEI